MGTNHGIVVGSMTTRADLSDRQLSVLQFAATQWVVLADQVARLLDLHSEDVDGLLADLTEAGMLVRDRIAFERADCFRITGAGLRAIESRRSPPHFGWHGGDAVGAAWLWLAGRGGTFGAADRVLSVLEMRAEDREGGAGAPFFVEPHEFGGSPKVHYPDLTLIRGSERTAVELLLALPAVEQLKAVLRAYAADVRVQEVMCVVVDPWAARVVQAAVASLELAPMVHVWPTRAWWRARLPTA